MYTLLIIQIPLVFVLVLISVRSRALLTLAIWKHCAQSGGGMCSELNVVSASARAPSAGPVQDEAVVVIVVVAAAPVLHVEKDDRCSSSSSSAV